MMPESLADVLLATALMVIGMCVAWVSGYAAGVRESDKQWTDGEE